MIGVGVVGYGYWGPNLVRNFVEIPGFELLAVCDRDPARLALAKRRHPHIATFQEISDLLKHSEISAVAIATPVGRHFELARECLCSGRHVLVEKPLARSSDQARRLVDEADRRNLVLMVDHTFLYTPAVRKIRELIRSGSIGELLYYDSIRCNLGLFQQDVSVLWDLGVHDIAIMDYLVSTAPIAVSACGTAHLTGQHENIAYITFFFPDHLIGHVHVNWLTPVKVRRTLIGGNKRMVVYDDVEVAEKVRVYDKGATIRNHPEAVHSLLINYRTGDMFAPHLETTEALRTELEQFLACIQTGESSPSDGRAGLRVVRWLEAAEKSLMLQGQPIELSSIE